MTHRAAFLLVSLEGSGLFHTVPGAVYGAPTFPCSFHFSAFR